MNLDHGNMEEWEAYMEYEMRLTHECNNRCPSCIASKLQDQQLEFFYRSLIDARVQLLSRRSFNPMCKYCGSPSQRYHHLADTFEHVCPIEMNRLDELTTIAVAELVDSGDISWWFAVKILQDEDNHNMVVKNQLLNQEL